MFVNVGEAIVFLFPNLENFNWRFVGIERQGLEVATLMNGAFQAMAWGMFFLILTHIIFANRDFE